MDTLAEAHDQTQVVVDDEHRAPLVVADEADGLEQRVRLGLVHPGRGLVEEQEARPAGERAGDLDPPLLPVGERGGETIPVGRQLQALEQRADLLALGAARHGAHLDVLLDRHLGEESDLLERATDSQPGDLVGLPAGRVHAADADAAGGGVEHAAGDVEERRLAAAVRADQPDDLALADGQRDAVERTQPPEPLHDVLDRKRAVHDAGL